MGVWGISTSMLRVVSSGAEAQNLWMHGSVISAVQKDRNRAKHLLNVASAQTRQKKTYKMKTDRINDLKKKKRTLKYGSKKQVWFSLCV